jgi:hypothetical protein
MRIVMRMSVLMSLTIIGPLIGGAFTSEVMCGRNGVGWLYYLGNDGLWTAVGFGCRDHSPPSWVSDVGSEDVRFRKATACVCVAELDGLSMMWPAC